MILDELEGLETRAELAEILTTLFDRVTPRAEAVARAEAAAAGGYDRELWGRLNGEIGVVALTVPEELGGAGATLAESAVVLELVGRRAAAVPFLGAFLAVEALVRADDEVARDRWLEPLVAGEAAGAMSWTGALVAEETGSGWTVTGHVDQVVDGHNADVLVAPATSRDGQRWFAIDLAGCGRGRLETLDLTRELANLTLDGSAAIPIATDADALRRQLQDLATLALAVEQLGVAEQSLADAVEYAKVREQFGRTIGSFQALKHMLADMATEADLARSLVEHALWVAAERPTELTEAAAMAMLGASRAAVLASGENVQVHGGIGFSWEHPAHLYFRKARSNEALLTTRAELSERILDARGAFR